MSVAAVTWALYEVRDVSPADKLALVVLAEHAAPDGTGSWPSWKRIAEVAGVSRRTVARTIDGLEKRGLIRRGDQSRSVEALRAAGRDPRWAPVVWDLVMDGSHSARTQRGLPPVTDEDRDAHRAAASPPVRRGANLAPQGVDRPSPGPPSAIVAGQQGCQSDTPGSPLASKTCHPQRSSGAIGDTQNQEKNQETTTSHDLVGHTADSVVVGSGVNATDLAHALLVALPSEVSRQVGTGVLRRRCEGLVVTGWTPDDVWTAAGAHHWNGARGGAVIAWIDDLARDTGIRNGRLRRPAVSVPRLRSQIGTPGIEVEEPSDTTSVRKWAQAELSRILDSKRGATSAHIAES